MNKGGSDGERESGFGKRVLMGEGRVDRGEGGWGREGRRYRDCRVKTLIKFFFFSFLYSFVYLFIPLYMPRKYKPSFRAYEAREKKSLIPYCQQGIDRCEFIAINWSSSGGLLGMSLTKRRILAVQEM